MTYSRRAIVIGGSLCGLMSACLLLRRGWDVEIYERAGEPLSGRGAGIVTHPELLATLGRCGARIDDTIGVSVDTRIVLDAHGVEVARLRLPQILTSWGRLHAVLRAEFPDARYHLGRSLARAEQDERSVCAVFEDGSRVEGDVLIGADGVRSTLRAQLLPEVRSQYAGYIAWRGLIEERAFSPATHAKLFEQFAFCLPPGEQMIGYPVAGGDNGTRPGQRRYNLVWYRPADEAALADLLTDATGRRHDVAIPPPLIRPEHIERMRADARRLLAPVFVEAVELTQQPFFQPIYDVESTRLAFGRIALAGDAAFVARPHVGMGVTKASTDAERLTDALCSTDAVPEALRQYEAVRLRAGRTVIARARHLGAYMQAQISTPQERAMAERYRTPAAVLGETATPEQMWQANPA